MTHRQAHLLGALGLSSLLLALAVLWPQPALTQEATWDAALAARISGTWILAVSEDAARAAVEAGIAASVAGMPPLVDSMAASQLRERLPVSPRIVFTLTPERFESRFAHGTLTSVPGAPTRVPVPTDTSSMMEMTQLLRGGHLEQIFTTDGGRRWSTFTPNDDGSRLTLDAVVHSERLTTDVRFRITYRRAS